MPYFSFLTNKTDLDFSLRFRIQILPLSLLIALLFVVSTASCILAEKLGYGIEIVSPVFLSSPLKR